MIKNIALTFFCILFFSFCQAQKPLTSSRRSSFYTYVYKCNDDKIVRTFKLKNKVIDDKLLKNPIDSFKTDGKWNNTLPPGNYFIVSASGNKLNYQLLEIRSAWVKILINNVDVRFVVTDAAGKQINNAGVTINDHNVSFDTKMRTYRSNIRKKDALLKIDYAGVSNFYELKGVNNDSYGYKIVIFSPRWFRYQWNRLKRIFNRTNNDSWKYRQRLQRIEDYQSFMVFNKPMYKPLDTIKFKAFIMDRKGDPIAVNTLLVRIQTDAGDDGRVLGYVNSYRKGGFEYNVVLTDSLDLDLDEEYYISLEDPSSIKYKLDDYDGEMDDEEYLSKRMVYAAGKFEFEDYELKSTIFTMRTDKKINEPGNPLSIYLKAVDENDLPVQDGRVEITISNPIISQFKAQKLFIADTLWRYKLPLETFGETKVTLPDSIFPKADLRYRITADFLNSNNEHRSNMEYAEFKYNNYTIKSDLVADTLKITSYRNGKEIQATAQMYTIGYGFDTISKASVKLPTSIIINPNVATYHIETDSVKQIIDMAQMDAGLSVSGYRTADSLFAEVSNPHEVPFWYWVSDGKKLFDAGNNGSLSYKVPYSNPGTVKLAISYIWAGNSLRQFADIAYADKILNIAVKQPLSVYPGQEIKTEIQVSDAEGKPVANADITAWSLTRKFNDYSIPNIPYWGKMPAAIRIKSSNTIKTGDNSASKKLHWEKWHRELGLDSIKYYQFTHPKNIYKIEETAPDSITQVAPFVIRGGELKPVNILYIDAEPVYFDQAQQMSRYSFRVSPGRHNFTFRTADESISIDTVSVKKGVKLIFSVQDTVSNPLISIKKAPLELEKYEADRINNYLIKVVDNFEARMAHVEQDNNLFLLNQNPVTANYARQILVGPLQPNTAFLNVKGQPWRSFLVEPKYSYLFEPGLLKQKSIPMQYPFAISNTPGSKSTNFTEYALTNNELDKIWQKFLDLRSHTTSLFTNPPITDKVAGNLIINADSKNDPALFIKNVIIYRKTNPDYLRVYPGNTTHFGQLGAGADYRIFYLLANNAYYMVDDVAVKAYGTNYCEIELTAKPADGVSAQIDQIISNRTGRNQRSDSEVRNDALRLKEAFNDEYLDNAAFSHRMGGRITDDKGEAMPGVTIMVRGITKAVATDANGEFTMQVPPSGWLLIRYVGYKSKEVEIRPGTLVNITLEEENMSLNEIVVVGYGISKKADLVGSVAGLVGATGNISIRGARSIGEGKGKPLIVVDGVLVESMDGIDAANILETNILKDDAATAIYGSRAANGVIIITTNKKNGKQVIIDNADGAGQAADEATIRKNFSDYAYWQPKLTTDAQGKVSFTNTFPDDITNWRTFVAGIGPQKQSGSAQAQIKSFKPLSANLVSPQFAIAGDEMSILGKVLNYTTTPAKINRVFKYNNQLLKQNELEAIGSRIDTFNVVASGKDSLTFEYTIKKESGYYDGEQRKIPLMPHGVTETKGSFQALDKDTAVTMQFDEAFGPVTFRAEASVLPTLAEETKRLREYKYLCNEQLASKLKGLLAEKRINSYWGQPFKWEKNITEVIKKLEDNRRREGTWGWWKDTDEELWISVHAIEALTEAKKEGYPIKIDQSKLIDYLVYQLNSYKAIDKILCLQLLRNLDAKVNYEQYCTVIQKELTAQKYPTRYDAYRLMFLQQSSGVKIKTDDLINQMNRTLFGNVYWGENNYNFFDNSIQLSVIAYKILKQDGKHSDLLTKIRGYFLEQRRDGEWRNTYESALILETILPDLLTADKTLTPPIIVLSGTKTAMVSTFPYSETFAPGTLSIKKTGTLPVYITGYQQFFNSNPQKVSKEFRVDTWFEKNGSKLSTLKGGQAVTLEAEVTVKGDADYVMINIPIPAGCSYESKEQSSQNGEVHREYFKERVSIFCRKLKQGKYTFTVNLMPRYSGKYNLNPAKVEMMYFPVFYGREGMKKVNIGN